MYNKAFHTKITSCLLALLLLLSVQASISHGVDLDGQHHSEHHCSLFQSCTQLMSVTVPAIAVIFSTFIKASSPALQLPQLHALTARVRGPPDILFPV